MFPLCACVFLQHYRIHMDIGNSKNYLGMFRLSQAYSQVALGVSNVRVDAVVLKKDTYILTDRW